MASRLLQLFQRGDQVEHAFIVERGPIYVELPGLEVAELPGQNLLVGTLELFLNDLLPRNPERLFTLSVLRDLAAEYSKSTTREMMRLTKFYKALVWHVLRLMLLCCGK